MNLNVRNLSLLKKIFLSSFLTLFTASAVTLIVCNVIVVNNSEGKIYNNTANIPVSEAGLLLGTTPQTRIGRKTNYFFKYRIDAAEALYRAGKIKYIVISGDDNSLDGVNEPQCMKDSLIARGLPANIFFTDGKGFRTLDSVVRMSKIFGFNTYTVISQKFHNERAIYLAERTIPESERITAFNAKDPKSNMAVITYIREYFARVKMFIDIFTGKASEIL